jgi:hypothetical protein
MKSSIDVTDGVGAAGAVAPRVGLADIKANIEAVVYFRGGDVVPREQALSKELLRTLDTFTVCMVIMRNGFIVIGKSAPASPENYDPEKGRTFAYEECIRQLWPLMGYSLRDKMMEQDNANAAEANSRPA